MNSSSLLAAPLFAILIFSGLGQKSDAASVKPPSFSAPVPITNTGVTISNILSSYDMDGDGHRDLVIADHGSGTVTVKLNTDGVGANFANASVLSFFADSVDWVAAGNLAHSGTATGGLPDLAVANGGQVTVEANQGLVSGTVAFNTIATLSDPNYYFVRVAVADLDGDGYDDLIVTAQAYDSSDPQLLVFFNLGDSGPGFMDPIYYDTGADYADNVAAGDLNGDGKPDVALAVEGQSLGGFGIEIFTNDGFGNLSQETYVAPPGPGLNSLRIGNLAGHADKRSDIFATGSEFFRTSTGGISEVDGFIALVNRGDDTYFWSGPIPTAAPFGVTSPTQTYGGADIFAYNKGGAASVVTADPSDGNVTLLTFAATTDSQGLVNSLKASPSFHRYATAPECSSITVSDLNGDGPPDIVVGLRPPPSAPAITGSTGVYVLLNSSVAGPSPVLSVDASTSNDNGSAFMGDTIQYTISYANEGGVDAENVILGVKLPSAATYVNASASGDASPVTVKGVVRGLSWNLGAVPKNSNGFQTFSVQVASSLVVGKKLTGNAVIGNPFSTDAANLPTILVQNSLALNPVAVAASSSGTTTTPGDTITYTLNYQNQSTLPVDNAVLTCTVPGKTTLVDDSGATLKKTTMKWTLGTLAPQSSASKVFHVTVNAGTPNNTLLSGVAKINATGLTTKASASNITVNLPAVDNLVP